MSWEPELEELRRREELARRMGGEERVERQHASGRLTSRERIERLLDEGTFHETGALAGRGAYGDDGELTAFLPANTVVGQGRIDGRRAVVEGDDFTVRCGSRGRPATGAPSDGGRPRGGLPSRAGGRRGPGRAARGDLRQARGGDLPIQDAERFSVEEIIDPRDTRPILFDWAERAHELVRHDLHRGAKTRGLRP